MGRIYVCIGDQVYGYCGNEGKFKEIVRFIDLGKKGKLYVCKKCGSDAFQVYKRKSKNGLKELKKKIKKHKKLSEDKNLNEAERKSHRFEYSFLQSNLKILKNQKKLKKLGSE